jgi:hypothetical protein
MEYRMNNHKIPGWRTMLGILMLALLIAILGGCEKAKPSEKKNEGRPRDMSIAARDGRFKDPYLEVHWPAQHETQQAITLRIPREYLDDRGTLTDEKGIHTISVDFELPGPMPVQARPWLKGKQGTPEYKEFMRTWKGRFTVIVNRDAVRGYDYRISMRKHAEPRGNARDTDLAGLERYSRKICYTAENLKVPAYRAFLDGKEADDSSPLNCRLQRLDALLMSPIEIKNDDDGVAMDCDPTGCQAYFSVAGRGLRIGFAEKDIPRWKEIVEPARQLVRSFIMPETSLIPPETK